jgi:hypothetical protein
MSSIAAERIAKEFASKGSEIITETRKELTAMDIRAARENLKLSLQAQAQATEQANEIARVEREKKAQEEAWRNQKIQGIVNAAGQAAGSMLKLVELGEGMSKQTATAETTASGPLNTMSATPMIGSTDPTPQPLAPIDKFGMPDLNKDNMFGLSFFNMDDGLKKKTEWGWESGLIPDLSGFSMLEE